jgi:hypothetical protein
MFILIIKNISNFIKNKPAVFLFYIFTLIVVSFLGIFILNQLSQSFFRNYFINADYFVEFSEAQDYRLIKNALKNNNLYPSQEYYLNENAALYNKYITEPIEIGKKYFFHVEGRGLEKDEPVGVFGYKCNSIYMTSDGRMESGRYLDSKDVKTKNAMIAYIMKNRVNNGIIDTENVSYNVIGALETFSPLYLNSIAIDSETFCDMGYKVKKMHFYFEVPPFKKDLQSFENALKSISLSNIDTIICFNKDTVISIITNCALYLVLFMLVIISVTAIFSCWLSNGNRYYSVYQICGLSKTKKRIMLGIEILLYVLFTSSVGTVLYFILLNSRYKHYIYYPAPVLVVINVLIIFLICLLLVFKQNKKTEKHSMIYNL